jgi:hypothetical protein
VSTDLIHGSTVASSNDSGSPQPGRWRCYGWTGAVVPDCQRRDPTTPTPPLLVRDWVNKPQSMLVKTCTDPSEAIAWLRNEATQWAPQLLPADPERLGRLLGYLDHRQAPDPNLVHTCCYGPCDVLCEIVRHDRIVHWSHHVSANQELVWALVPIQG